MTRDKVVCDRLCVTSPGGDFTMAFGQIFSKDTQAIFFNWKPIPVQRMLDFDFLCGETVSLCRTAKRQTPSPWQAAFQVAADITVSTASTHSSKSWFPAYSCSCQLSVGDALEEL